MDFVFEIVCTGDTGHADAARAWFDDSAQNWRALAGLVALDLYRPVTAGAHDPFNNDGAGPLFIAMLAFGTREALVSAARTMIVDDAPARFAITRTAMERAFYPVAGQVTPAPLSAPFSYVVRYHKPAEDEAAFVQNYVATHPPTLALLPGIRSVMCYFPLPITTDGIQSVDYIIGNEVAFDSIEAFNAAMQSPVRQELRRHFHEFPKFFGANTHFPMNRTRVFG